MTTSPKHLSDTVLLVLGRAADSESQMLLPIPRSVRARGKALERVMQSLLNQGFAEEVPVGLADEAWRSDDPGRFGLRITAAGLRGDRGTGVDERTRSCAGGRSAQRGRRTHRDA